VISQNWLAVGIDFGIVVAGVFLGIQLGNWNDARAEKERFSDAIDQLLEEIDTNRAIVEEYRQTYVVRVADVQAAAHTLERCPQDPGEQQAVIKALQHLRSTPGFYPQISAVRDLTEDNVLKRLQTEEARQQIQNLRRILERVDEGSAFLEDMPFRSPIENHPMVGYGSVDSEEYAGSGILRGIVLTVPFEQACANRDLLKSFYLYERVGSFAVRLADIADGVLDETEAALRD